MTLADGACVAMIEDCANSGCRHSDLTCRTVKTRVDVARIFDADAENADANERKHLEAQAIAVCIRCPVRRECLEYLAATPSLWRFGPIYGGLTYTERQRFQHPGDGAPVVDIERALRASDAKVDAVEVA